VVLPEDGREIYFEAFDAARREIRIEICVLEDPLVLQSLKQAIDRGVRVRVIVDHGKYEALPSERVNLAAYLTGAGAELHLSNPIFPRSFPKVILIDGRYAIIGSACLDATTFAQYRDYAYVSGEPGIVKDLSRLFENDWRHSAHPGQSFPTYNPTPAIMRPDLIVSPVNAAYRLVSFIQKVERTLDVTSELLGDPTLESELAAAAAKGVRVRLIAPEIVNGATRDIQQLQLSSLSALKAAGLHIHVTRPPESPESPYMHARTAVADGKRAYLGSISLSPDSTTYNREVGVILDDTHFVRRLQNQFEIDFNSKSQVY
jgi:phosphatidylserine/phosphatidylglycerophosphate/cardiolipin synthase-like enzyme